MSDNTLIGLGLVFGVFVGFIVYYVGRLIVRPDSQEYPWGAELKVRTWAIAAFTPAIFVYTAAVLFSRIPTGG